MSLDKAELCDSLLTWVSSASSASQANYRARRLTGDRQQVLAEEGLKTHPSDNNAKRSLASYSGLLSCCIQGLT